MNTSDFYEMIKKVEKSYKGFNVFKSGSLSDKLIFSVCVLLYIVASVILFWGNIFSENFIIKLSSLLIFLIVFIFSFTFNRKLQRRENFFYQKGQSREEEFLNQFIQNLSKNYIKESVYNKIIEYYNKKIKKNQSYSDKYTVNYFICFLIPVIISFCEKEEIIPYLLVVGIIGLVLTPGIWMSLSFIINRKQIMYNNIIYYLELALLMKKTDTSTNDK